MGAGWFYPSWMRKRTSCSGGRALNKQFLNLTAAMDQGVAGGLHTLWLAKRHCATSLDASHVDTLCLKPWEEGAGNHPARAR